MISDFHRQRNVRTQMTRKNKIINIRRSLSYFKKTAIVFKRKRSKIKIIRREAKT